MFRAKSLIVSLVVSLVFVPLSLNAQDNALLWKVTGGDLTQSSYLFGTIHLKDARVAKFDSTVWRSFYSCEQLSGELVFDFATILKAAEYAKLPEGTKLKDLYNADEYGRIKTYLDKYLGGMSDAAESFKPLMLVGMIMESQSTELNQEPLDLMFQTEAKKQGKSLVAIEKVEEQMAAFDSFSLQEQAKMLLESLDEIDSEGGLSKDFERMVQAYLDQDLGALEEIIKESGADVDVENKLITSRNLRMAKRIGNFMRHTSTFNTFGAGHLYGPQGIVNLLKLQGFVVEPIHFKFTD